MANSLYLSLRFKMSCWPRSRSAGDGTAKLFSSLMLPGTLSASWRSRDWAFTSGRSGRDCEVREGSKIGAWADEDGAMNNKSEATRREDEMNRMRFVS